MFIKTIANFSGKQEYLIAAVSNRDKGERHLFIATGTPLPFIACGVGFGKGKMFMLIFLSCKPILGHVSYSDTAYYLHLTTDLFPDITIRLDNELGDIIPVLNHFNGRDDEKGY